MAVGSASWSFTEDDFAAITHMLQRFLYDSNARCALLVDRTGQLVATVGEQPKFDPTTFATLTAAEKQRVQALRDRLRPDPLVALLIVVCLILLVAVVRATWR